MRYTFQYQAARTVASHSSFEMSEKPSSQAHTPLAHISNSSTSSAVNTSPVDANASWTLDVDTVYALKADVNNDDADSAMAAEAMVYDPQAVLRELDEDSPRRESLFENRNLRPPANLEFKDLCFSVGTRSILDHVGGCAQQGQVLAIMGPSGAGKTTLLHMLAGRLVPSKGSTTSGTVMVNGKRRDFDSFRQMSAYVLQEDNFFPELTVKETVSLAALLRLPREMPDEQKLLRVEQVSCNS